MKKILVSHGYGAGWSSWTPQYGQFMAEYQPIIDYIEGGGDPRELETPHAYDKVPLDRKHPLIQQLHHDIAEEFNIPVEDVYFYDGGVDGLVVEEVDGGPYRITEYDGAESVELASTIGWWS